MKSLSLLACLALVIFGGYTIVFAHNLAGIFLVIIGTLSFLIIAKKTQKIAGYNPRSFMNLCLIAFIISIAFTSCSVCRYGCPATGQHRYINNRFTK